MMYKYSAAVKQAYFNFSTIAVLHRWYSNLKNPKCGNGTIQEFDWNYISAAAVLLNNARNFVYESLRLGKSLRPNALWGLYGLPICNYNFGKIDEDYSCSALYQCLNDELRHIYAESDALYPSIYLEYDATALQPFRYAKAVIMESMRIAKIYDPPLRIYAYTRFEHVSPTQSIALYDESDICSTVKQAFYLGVDGLVFRSRKDDVEDRCDVVQNYVYRKLAPVVRRVVEFHDLCSIRKCNKNGKCVRKNIHDVKYFTDSCSNFTMNYSEYDCLCNPAYEGVHCSTSSANRTSLA